MPASYKHFDEQNDAAARRVRAAAGQWPWEFMPASNPDVWTAEMLQEFATLAEDIQKHATLNFGVLEIFLSDRVVKHRGKDLNKLTLHDLQAAQQHYFHGSHVESTNADHDSDPSCIVVRTTPQRVVKGTPKAVDKQAGSRRAKRARSKSPISICQSKKVKVQKERVPSGRVLRSQRQSETTVTLEEFENNLHPAKGKGERGSVVRRTVPQPEIEPGETLQQCLEIVNPKPPTVQMTAVEFEANLNPAKSLRRGRSAGHVDLSLENRRAQLAVPQCTEAPAEHSPIRDTIVVAVPASMFDVDYHAVDATRHPDVDTDVGDAQGAPGGDAQDTIDLSSEDIQADIPDAAIDDNGEVDYAVRGFVHNAIDDAINEAVESPDEESVVEDSEPEDLVHHDDDVAVKIRVSHHLPISHSHSHSQFSEDPESPYDHPPPTPDSPMSQAVRGYFDATSAHLNRLIDEYDEITADIDFVDGPCPIITQAEQRIAAYRHEFRTLRVSWRDKIRQVISAENALNPMIESEEIIEKIRDEYVRAHGFTPAWFPQYLRDMASAAAPHRELLQVRKMEEAIVRLEMAQTWCMARDNEHRLSGMRDAQREQSDRLHAELAEKQKEIDEWRAIAGMARLGPDAAHRIEEMHPGFNEWMGRYAGF